MASRLPRSQPALKRSASSPDHGAEALREGIRTGRYLPGQRLIESALTEELQISRGSVREAIRLVAAEGLVALNRNRGASVRHLSRREVDDILVIQESLTSLAARLAATRIDEPGHRARFQRAYSALQAADAKPQNEGALLDVRVRFYAELVAIGGNAELASFVPIPQTNVLRAQFERHLPRAERAKRRADYTAIAELILAGSAGPAAVAMGRHIRRMRAAIAALPEHLFAEAKPGNPGRRPR